MQRITRRIALRALCLGTAAALSRQALHDSHAQPSDEYIPLTEVVQADIPGISIERYHGISRDISGDLSDDYKLRLLKHLELSSTEKYIDYCGWISFTES